jgi:hypothetical protein
LATVALNCLFWTIYLFKTGTSYQKVWELRRSSHTSRGSSKAWQHRYAPDRMEIERREQYKRNKTKRYGNKQNQK